MLIVCAAMAQESTRGEAGPTRTAADVPPSEAWTVFSHLVTGFLLFGGLGWGADALLGTRWFLLVGLLLGGVASFALIYVRYVYVPPVPPSDGDHPPGPTDRKESE